MSDENFKVESPVFKGTPAPAPSTTSTTAPLSVGEITRQQYDDYQKRFVPIENQLIGMVGDKATNERLVNEAGTRSDAAFDSSAGALGRNLERLGVRPTAGQSASMQRRTGLARAIANADAKNTTRMANEDRDIAGLGNLVNTGRGIATGAMSGLEAAAGMQSQREQYNAQAKSAARGGLLQMATTIGSMYFMSSREFKSDITPTSREALLDDINAIDVVQFKYNPELEQPGVFVGAIAEDVPGIFANLDRTQLNAYNLIGALIASVQELTAQVQELKKGTNHVG